MSDDLNIDTAPNPDRKLRFLPSQLPLSNSSDAPSSKKQVAKGEEKSPPSVKHARSEKEEAEKEKEKVKKIQILLDKFEGKLTRKKNLKLNIVIDQERERPIFQIVDRDTGKVITEIPPDYLVKLSEKLEEMRHLLIDEIS